jgi:hypothetical protein
MWSRCWQKDGVQQRDSVSKLKAGKDRSNTIFWKFFFNFSVTIYSTSFEYEQTPNLCVYFYIRWLTYNFFLCCKSPQWAWASSLSRIYDHTQTHHTRYDSSGRVISSSQRPLPDKTQYSHKTDIHAPGGIRINNHSKQAAADQLLRPCGHRDRLYIN